MSPSEVELEKEWYIYLPKEVKELIKGLIAKKEEARFDVKKVEEKLQIIRDLIESNQKSEEI